MQMKDEIMIGMLFVHKTGVLQINKHYVQHNLACEIKRDICSYNFMLETARQKNSHDGTLPCCALGAHPTYPPLF